MFFWIKEDSKKTLIVLSRRVKLPKSCTSSLPFSYSKIEQTDWDKMNDTIPLSLSLSFSLSLFFPLFLSLSSFPDFFSWLFVCTLFRCKSHLTAGRLELIISSSTLTDSHYNAWLYRGQMDDFRPNSHGRKGAKYAMMICKPSSIKLAYHNLEGVNLLLLSQGRGNRRMCLFLYQARACTQRSQISWKREER